MTIKITQVSTSNGEVILTITYDNPAGSGQMFTYNLRKQDLFDRLTQIRGLLGRALTITDAKLALVEIINELRRNAAGIPQDFDFIPFTNVELEA
jgi:hypothetical protein